MIPPGGEYVGNVDPPASRLTVPVGVTRRMFELVDVASGARDVADQEYWFDRTAGVRGRHFAALVIM